MSIATDLQVPAQVEVVDGVHRGKWGYYPCDKETYLEIKEFHRYTLHDLRATKMAERWGAKLEKNRHGDEPMHKGTDFDYYEWILMEYRRARHPVHSQDRVSKLKLPSKWRSELEQMREFYGPLKK